MAKDKLRPEDEKIDLSRRGLLAPLALSPFIIAQAISSIGCGVKEEAKKVFVSDDERAERLAAELRRQFDIVSRAEWGADPPRLDGEFYRYEEDLKKVLRAIVIHHSGMASCPGPLAIQRAHMRRPLYCDIGYHFVIGADGVIYAGRPLEYMGAHAGETVEADALAERIRKKNERRGKKGAANLPALKRAFEMDPDYGSIGICLDGDFTANAPSLTQMASFHVLLAWLKTKFHIPAANIIMHRDVPRRIERSRSLTPAGGTVCPGDVPFESMMRRLPADTQRAEGKRI